MLDDLSWNLLTHFPWYLYASLLRDLLLHIHRVLSADSLGEFLALLPGHIYGEVLASLVWHLLTLCPWHRLLNFLWHLLAVLFWNLELVILLGHSIFITMTYLLTLLVVPIAVAFLLVACGALLLILPVHHRIIDHVALLLVHSPAPLLAAGVIHGATSGLGELVTMLLVTNVLQHKQVKTFLFPAF